MAPKTFLIPTIFPFQLFQSFTSEARDVTLEYCQTKGGPYSAACTFYDGRKQLPGYTKGNWPPLSESQKAKEIFNAYDPLLAHPPSQKRALSDAKKLGEKTLSKVRF